MCVCVCVCVCSCVCVCVCVKFVHMYMLCVLLFKCTVTNPSILLHLFLLSSLCFHQIMRLLGFSNLVSNFAALFIVFGKLLRVHS